MAGAAGRQYPYGLEVGLCTSPHAALRHPETIPSTPVLSERSVRWAWVSDWGDKLRRAKSCQLSFVFGDSPKGGEQVEVSDVSDSKAWLLLIASDKETTDLAAPAGEGD